VDRSRAGFVLSAAVGLVGTAVLLAADPAAIPTMAPPAPASSSSAAAAAAMPPPPYSATNASSSAAELAPALVLGGLARRDTLETAVWMASVLFCSCVCFGNIGRRLALKRPPVTAVAAR
jgi:hypothetical protein